MYPNSFPCQESVSALLYAQYVFEVGYVITEVTMHVCEWDKNRGLQNRMLHSRCMSYECTRLHHSVVAQKRNDKILLPLQLKITRIRKFKNVTRILIVAQSKKLHVLSVMSS